ncbi:hypothetical protein D3C72_1587640 [compost metagenome]
MVTAVRVEAGKCEHNDRSSSRMTSMRAPCCKEASPSTLISWMTLAAKPSSLAGGSAALASVLSLE